MSVDYAEQVAAVIAKLKPGTYEVVSALANVSIASVPVRIADALGQGVLGID